MDRAVKEPHLAAEVLQEEGDGALQGGGVARGHQDAQVLQRRDDASSILAVDAEGQVCQPLLRVQLDGRHHAKVIKYQRACIPQGTEVRLHGRWYRQ